MPRGGRSGIGVRSAEWRRWREHDPALPSGCFTDDVGSIRLETLIAAPAGECFQLSLSADAHTASMSGPGERAIGGVTSGVMKLGDTVTWRARHFGVAFGMTSAITSYEYPGRFAGEQQRGSFRRWWHQHTSVAIAPLTAPALAHAASCAACRRGIVRRAGSGSEETG
jgi:hypothetical protein